MNRQPIPRLAARPMNTVGGALAAIAALLSVATVTASVLDGETQLGWGRTPDATLGNWRDADRKCALYRSVANSAHSRGWVYSDAGLTPTFRSWCVYGAGGSQTVLTVSALSVSSR